MFRLQRVIKHFQSTRNFTDRAGIPFHIDAVPVEFAAERNIGSGHQCENPSDATGRDPETVRKALRIQ
jgi:hypothetical protein